MKVACIKVNMKHHHKSTINGNNLLMFEMIQLSTLPKRSRTDWHLMLTPSDKVSSTTKTARTSRTTTGFKFLKLASKHLKAPRSRKSHHRSQFWRRIRRRLQDRQSSRSPLGINPLAPQPCQMRAKKFSRVLSMHRRSRERSQLVIRVLHQLDSQLNGSSAPSAWKLISRGTKTWTSTRATTSASESNASSRSSTWLRTPWISCCSKFTNRSIQLTIHLTIPNCFDRFVFNNIINLKNKPNVAFKK